jgi:hypothetical protein
MTDEPNLEKRLTQLKLEVPARGLERFPSVVETVNDLPAELRSPAVSALASGEAIQFIVSFPAQIQRGWHYVPRQALLFSPTDVIHILASIWPGQEPQITHVCGSGLMYMKVTLILLYGSLEIVARGSAGPTRLGMEFSTVAWERISQPARQLLQAARAATGAPTGGARISTVALPDFEKLPLKFSNGTEIHGLLPGEELESLVFQPAVWKRWLVWFRKPVLANTLVLLSSNYLVVIEEEPGVEQGWMLSYIPRSNILGIQNRPCVEWDELTIRLECGGQSAALKILLRDQVVRDWRERWLKAGGLWQDLADISPEKGTSI